MDKEERDRIDEEIFEDGGFEIIRDGVKMIMQGDGEFVPVDPDMRAAYDTGKIYKQDVDAAERGYLWVVEFVRDDLEGAPSWQFPTYGKALTFLLLVDKGMDVEQAYSQAIGG